MTASPLELAICSGHLVLTPNHRLKRALLKKYRGHSPSELPQQILALSEWTEKLWLQLQARGFDGCNRQLVAPHQSSLIWQRIIRDNSQDCDLINPTQLSQHASSAAQTLDLWQLSLDELDKFDSDSGSQLKTWCTHYQQTLERQNLASREYAIKRIIEAAKVGELTIHADIYLYAFEQIPPLQTDLLATLSRNLHRIAATQCDNAQSARLTLASSEDELRSAAQWARDKLEFNIKQKIAIIAPNLGQCRGDIERIFTEVFEPQSLLTRSPSYTLPFNFSAGIPLSNTAPILDALELLNLHRDNWPSNEICQLLQSPFFSDLDAELELRCELVKRLQQLRKTHISGTDLRFNLEQLQTKINTTNDEQLNLSEILQSLSSEQRRQPRQASALQWQQILQQELNHLGWPGTRRLNSHEHQQVAQWYELLQSFSRLDECGYKLSRSEAVNTLRSMAQNHHFQAQTPDSPIQILGALEGAGLEFDACWIIGMNSRSWPPAASPNPLLPAQMQRQYNMPHASAERELLIASALTEGYKRCAQEVFFSNASSGQGTSDHPSSLIAKLPVADTERFSKQSNNDKSSVKNPQLQDYIDSIIASAALEKRQDHNGPAISAQELLRIRGGSSLFRDQASCPLIAFASHRLGAKPVPAASIGLTAIDRGNLIHSVLEQFWLKVKSSRELHRLTREEQEQLCTDFVRTALTPYRRKLIEQLPEAFFDLEAQRLTTLATSWLEQDRNRAEFEAIAVEQKNETTFAGIPLDLRLDRLDQLADGRHLLIDYKTGKPQLNQWQGDRPAEPQLPLYTMTSACGGSNIGAIAFARVTNNNCEFIGFGDLNDESNTQVSGIKNAKDCPKLDLPDNWDDVLEHWHKVLTALADDFKAGKSDSDFRDANAERYSEDYRPLTRQFERDQVANFSPRPATEEPQATNTPPIQGELL